MSARPLDALEEGARAARPREVESFKVVRYDHGGGRFYFGSMYLAHRVGGDNLFT